MTLNTWSHAELQEHLAEQMAWLASSTCAYDDGVEHEAKRIAHVMRTLLHEMKKSRSLLTQLGVKETLRFWSVLPAFDSPALSFVGVRMQMEIADGQMTGRYLPNLGQPEQRLPFTQWWGQEPILVTDAHIVTRKRAVLDLAHLDGGSHVAPRLTDLERELLRTDPFKFRKVTLLGPTPIVLNEETVAPGVRARVSHMETSTVTELPSDLSSPVRAVVRQAAHELHGTLSEYLASGS